MADLIGTRVGNYVVEKQLGVGGMGAVYLARHPEIGLEVAIKVLAPELLTSEAAAARFLSEAKALTRVVHPGVIRIQDFGRLSDGRLYYQMEVLEGRELEEVLEERGAMSPGLVLEYLEQLCPALQAAHDHGVVHRDLKPSNIYVLSGDALTLKILDFGLAKLLQSHHDDADQTAAGMVMGTPHFIAPEQAAGQPEAICAQTDLYSLGVILYLMLSGKHPISGENTATLLLKQITTPPTPLREVAPDVPVPVARVIHRCLEKRAQDRPESAAALLEAYRGALSGTERGAGAGSVDAIGETAAPGQPTSNPAQPTSNPAQPTSHPALDSTMAQPELARPATPVEPAPARPGSTAAPLELATPKQRQPVASGGPMTFSDELTGAPLSETRPPEVRKSSATPMIAALVLLALVGGGAGIYLATRGDQPTPAASAQLDATPTITPTAPDKHTILVPGATAAICQAWVDGAPHAVERCEQLEVERGRRLRLKVQANGFAPLDKTWKVEADRTLQLKPVKVATSPRPATRPPTRTPRPAVPKTPAVKAPAAKTPPAVKPPTIAKQPAPPPTPAKPATPAKPVSKQKGLRADDDIDVGSMDFNQK